MSSSYSSSTGSTPHTEFSSASSASLDVTKLSPAVGLLHSRKCRTLGSCLDRWEPLKDGYVNEDLRVGVPLLCQIPAVTLPVPRTSRELENLIDSEPSLIQDFIPVLKRFNVRWTDIGICARQSMFNPMPTPISTVLIFAKRERLDGAWMEAAKSIHQELLARGFQNVQVEIADKEAFRLPRCSPVLATDTIFPMWDGVCQTILLSFSLREWVSLECYRYGKGDDPAKNPPTIIVSVFPHSRTNWTPVRTKIISILHEFKLWDVGVHILPDRIVRAGDGSDAALPDTACQQKAQAGLSLGLNLPKSGSGTLGGFVELQWQGDVAWKRFGLTCFHCVYPNAWKVPPAEQHRIHHWYSNPVLPADPNAAKLLKVCQPSLVDMEAQIKYLDSTIDSFRTLRFCQIEADILADNSVPPKDQALYDTYYDGLKPFLEQKERIENFCSADQA